MGPRCVWYRSWMAEASRTKQVGIRLPVALWERALLIAAAEGMRPGAYVASVLEVAVLRGEHRLRDRLVSKSVSTTRPARRRKV